MPLATRVVTSSSPVTGDDFVILADATAGNIVLTMDPVLNRSGGNVLVKKIDASANTVTLVAGDGAEVIGENVISLQGERVGFVTDGVKWHIVQKSAAGAFALAAAGVPAGGAAGQVLVKATSGELDTMWDDPAAGSAGPQGIQGLPGADGAQGPQGIQGIQGPPGADGAQGPQGIQGIQGPPGADGAAGSQGPPGLNGTNGLDGAPGAAGAQGIQGPPGADGLPGADGAQGPQGIQGTTGDTGPQGSAGAQGIQGLTGDTGPQGSAGAQGIQGLLGLTGPAGPVVLTIPVQALTSSPTDAQTMYFGSLPKAPITTAAVSKIYFRAAGTLKRAEIYCYSGTAGTAEAWSLYVRKNNTLDTLIATVSAATSERIFSNTNLNIAILAGDYIEIKAVNPTWATNPLTTIFGGHLVFEQA